MNILIKLMSIVALVIAPHISINPAHNLPDDAVMELKIETEKLTTEKIDVLELKE
jgi:K(+)-stimulated pyrophosphate-energized sodium pump